MRMDGSRRWLYPVLSPGRWLRRRKLVGWALIALFFGLPIVHVGGKPAMLLDIVHRQFTLFGKTFYATDTMLLMLFGIIALLAIVLLSALLGRAWCGWACPQTVYLEFIFRPIERLLEGKETARKRRDAGPMTADKALRKGVKHLLYLLIAAALAHSFVAYFVGWAELRLWMVTSPREHWPFFVMMMITTGLVYFDFAYFREQMCTIACPYARIQSVLLDPHSLIVSYDAARGEPRGRRKRGAKKEAPIEGEARLDLNALGARLGDCIDCGACVRTCPTGIDIRDGLQMECINCTQCIDACDAIMLSVNKPIGLVRYTSERALAGERTRALRPRIILYVSVLIMLIGVFAFAISGKSGLDVALLRAPGAPFMVLPDGQVANRLEIRAQNRSAAPQPMRLEALAPQGATLKIVGSGEVTLEPGQLQRVQVWMTVPAEVFERGRADGRVRVSAGPHLAHEVDVKLLGPHKR